MRMRSLRFVAATLAFVFLAQDLATAQSTADWTDPLGSPSLVLERFPRAARAWQAAVPSQYRGTPWIYALAGTSSEPTIERIGAVKYVLGSVCKPHDCYNNQLVYLISLDRGRVSGALLVHGDEGRNDVTFFGTYTAEEQQLLQSRFID